MHRVLPCALVAFVLIAPCPAAAQTIWRGPYLNDVTRDAVTILWETPAPQAATVRYGLNSVNEHEVGVLVGGRHQSVRLTGLEALAGGPNAEFLYEVEVDGEVRAGRFHTAVDSSTPFAFVVYGDNRSSPVQHTAVVDAILNEPVPVRFLVSSGDMVSDGENEDHWDSFFAIEEPALRGLPFYATLGNHEVDGSNWDVTERLFEPPTTVPPASDTRAYYHFVYGNTEIIVIDSEINTLYKLSGFSLPGGQEEWLQDVLDNPPAGVQHRFLIVHQGPYTSKDGRTGNYWLRFWLQDLKEAGINAIISGHDHYAERGWANNGLPYLIHGGGGAPLYDTFGPRVLGDHTVVLSQARLGYVLIEVNGSVAQVSIKGIDGETLDTFSYGDTVNPECTVASDCPIGVPPMYGCGGGAWDCYQRACVYTCPEDFGSIVGCLTTSDCESDMGATCSGDVSCEYPDANPLSWHCRCSTSAECNSPIDCNGPPPVAGCEGDWDCVDDVCEFVPSAGACGAAPDGGSDDGAASDGGPPDGGPTGDPALVGDSAPAAGDPVSPPVAAPDGGCGCRGSGGSLWLAGLALLAWRRRRR